MHYSKGDTRKVLGAAKLKDLSFATLAPVAFYTITGILLLILLPLSNFAPHIGLTGVVSLITAYSVFTKRPWAKWLIAALFFVVTTMVLFTVVLVFFSNVLVSLGLLAYAILTWYFTYYAFIKKI
jgi:hypothetical protein